MKSIERRFNRVQKQNPQWSSYNCFVEAIKDQSFTSGTMKRWFYKLVDTKDYSKKDKKAMLQGLKGLLKRAEDDKYWG